MLLIGGSDGVVIMSFYVTSTSRSIDLIALPFVEAFPRSRDIKLIRVQLYYEDNAIKLALNLYIMISNF